MLLIIEGDNSIIQPSNRKKLLIVEDDKSIIQLARYKFVRLSRERRNCKRHATADLTSQKTYL